MPPKVEVVHATSPLCHWSWGYEPVMNRLQMVYGSRVSLAIGQAIPYVAREKWLEDYEMTPDEAMTFVAEIVEAGGLPVRLPASWSGMPASCLPAAVAVKSAGVALGPRAERRLARRLMHACFVEGRDTSDDAVLADVVREAGLDLDAVLKASGDDATRALEEDAARLGHGANFFSLLVRDGKGTTVTLERAYDPARVESAIDWLTDGKLPKREPTDVGAYVREHGPVATEEIAVAFALPRADAKKALAALEREGAVERVAYEGLPRATFWREARE